MIARQAISRRTLRPDGAAAFTLIELLIVITIISILISITIGVGFSVVQNQGRATTVGVLKALDGALDEFIAETGVVPRYISTAYARMPGLDIEPGDRENLDDTGTGDFAFSDFLGRMHPRRPDASVFLSQTLGYGKVDSILQAVPSRFVVLTIPNKSVNDCESASGAPGSNDIVDCDTTPSIIDAWGDPAWGTQNGAMNGPYFPTAAQQLIYYVHPSNRLARALYGDTSNDRPYFLSAGPDKLYGLPEEFTAVGKDLFTAKDRQFRRMQGESDNDFKQRVLREARADNITSYPVDLEFSLPEQLLNPNSGWRPAP